MLFQSETLLSNNLTQHQRGLIQLMDELEAMVDRDAPTTDQKYKTEEINDIANLLNNRFWTFSSIYHIISTIIALSL